MIYRSIIADLVAADVAFVVIGGVAASLHGSARLTYDIDICYEPTEDNIRRLAAVLALWNAYLRGVEPGLPFEMDERMLRNTPVMTLITDHGAIDVMDRVAGVGEYADVLAASVEADANGLRFRVLGLEGLLRAKRATGRPRDKEQIPELEALLKLKRRAAT